MLRIAGGEDKGREKDLPLITQFSAAVSAPETIRPSTITVVKSENLRSVLINFSPFNPHKKSEPDHSYTVDRKNLHTFPGMRRIFSSPLRADKTKSDANLEAYRPLTPSPTFRVVFPAYRNPWIVPRVCKGKRLPYGFTGVQAGSGVT